MSVVLEYVRRSCEQRRSRLESSVPERRYDCSSWLLVAMCRKLSDVCRKCASSHASVVKSARLAGCEGIEPARFSDRVPDLSGDRRITNRNAVWIHSLCSMRGFAASVSIFGLA